MQTISTDLREDTARYITYHNTRSFYKANGKLLASLSLDIGSSHKVNDYGYFLDASLRQIWEPLFLQLEQLIKGKEIHRVLGLSWKDFRPMNDSQRSEDLPFFNMAILLLNDAIGNYRGIIPSVATVKQLSPDDLLCCCFGVYGQEARDYYSSITHEITESDFLKFTCTTKAGIGCGSCAQEFKRVHQQYLNDSICVGGERVFFYDGMSPSEFCLKINEFIILWLSERDLEPDQVEIMEIYQNQLLCKIHLEKELNYQLNKIIKDKFQLELTAIFLS